MHCYRLLQASITAPAQTSPSTDCVISTGTYERDMDTSAEFDNEVCIVFCYLHDVIFFSVILL